MSVLPIKKICICAFNKDKKNILEMIQKQETVEISESSIRDDIFVSEAASGFEEEFRRNAKRCEQALDILSSRIPEKKNMLASLKGRTIITNDQRDEFISHHHDTLDTVNKLIALDREYAENVAEIPKIDAQISSLIPWKNYDMPLNYTGTDKTEVIVGMLPGEVTLEELLSQLAANAPEVEDISADIISSSKEQTCIFIICSKKESDKVWDTLRKMNFAKPPQSSLNPAEELKVLNEKTRQVLAHADELSAQISSYADRREDIKFCSDYYTMRADRYDAMKKISTSKRMFVLEGYATSDNATKIEKKITDQYIATVDISDPSEDDDVPVVLKNNGFARPVESVIESYSLPAKGEIDPSMAVALFYYIFYGIMLSDAGYGIIVALATGICLVKYKDMEKGLRSTMTMFFYCGISTIVAGFLFGSFFGDVVNVVATTFFNRPDITLSAGWFEPLNSPMRMLSICFAIGIIHLFFGLGIKMYMQIKNGQILDAIYDCIFWYMLVGGLIVLLLTQKMFTEMLLLPGTLPRIAGKIATILAIIGAVGIILTGGRESKNWGKRILKGIYGVYGVSSYLSDILSYSRLLALGLATGVIAMVFNKMGSMGGNTVFGAIMFILVLIVGNTLNLLINALGAYVHTNRLIYVEFFGKFYEGGGRALIPFASNTKYYKFKEEK